MVLLYLFNLSMLNNANFRGVFNNEKYRRLYMKLIRYKGTYTYNIESSKLTDYEMLTQYNPLFISKKIRLIELFINDLYHLNQSHVTCCDARGVVSVSYPLDKLVFYIIEQKDRLQHYREASDIKLSMVKAVIRTIYTPGAERNNGIYEK